MALAGTSRRRPHWRIFNQRPMACLSSVFILEEATYFVIRHCQLIWGLSSHSMGYRRAVWMRTKFRTRKLKTWLLITLKLFAASNLMAHTCWADGQWEVSSHMRWHNNWKRRGSGCRY